MAEKTKLSVEERRKLRIARQKEIADRFSTMENSQKEMKATIEKQNERLAQYEKLDIKSLLEEIERLKEGSSQIRRAIRRSRTGLYVPGIEDVDNFSLIRAIVSAKTSGKVYGESSEWKIMQEAREKAGQSLGTDAEGGWFVPDQVIPEVIEAIYRRSVLINLAGDGTSRVTTLDGLTGGRVRIPKFKKGTVAFWQGEGDATTISNVNTGEVTMTPKKLAVLAKMTEEQMRFSAYGFEALLRQDMVRAAAQELDRTVLFGKGNDNEPRGIVNLANVQKFWAETGSTTKPASPVGGLLDWTGLSKVDLLIEEQDLEFDGSFATISSPAFFRHIAMLRNLNFAGQASTSAGYIAGLPPVTQARLADLIGSFGKTNNISSVKDFNSVLKFTDVFRGNFSEILLGRWSGLEIVTDDGMSGDNFIRDVRLIKLRLWADIGSRHDEAIVWVQDAQARE